MLGAAILQVGGIYAYVDIIHWLIYSIGFQVMLEVGSYLKYYQVNLHNSKPATSAGFQWSRFAF